MTAEVPKSAASRNLDNALIVAGIACICAGFSWGIAAACCLGIAAVFACNAVKCVLDVQEMNMHLLNEILKRLSRKDNDDDK